MRKRNVLVENTTEVLVSNHATSCCKLVEELGTHARLGSARESRARGSILLSRQFFSTIAMENKRFKSMLRFPVSLFYQEIKPFFNFCA